jgi:hypothetical protein
LKEHATFRHLTFRSAALCFAVSESAPKVGCDFRRDLLFEQKKFVAPKELLESRGLAPEARNS